MRRVLALVAGVLGALLVAVLPAAAEDVLEVTVFGTETCPYCAMLDEDLAALEAVHGDALRVERIDVGADQAGRDRWVTELAARGQEAAGVPTVLVGDEVLVGYDPGIADGLDALLVARRSSVAADGQVPDGEGSAGSGSSGAVAGSGSSGAVADAAPAGETIGTPTVRIPVVGEVSVAQRSAVASTALIALVDGVNPCSLWVLTVLLAMVLHAGASRGRVALIGGVFLTVTGLIYGLFIAGVFTVLGVVEHVGALRVGVAVIALTVGLINVKDYVWFKRGPSLTIPDAAKPRIYRAGRRVRQGNRSLPAVLGTTVAMAAGVALVELPCTAGFPVVWSGIMHQQGIEGGAFAGLLALYLGIYILDEVVLFAIVLATLRIARFQERHGRQLKLLAGTVMVALGVVLLTAPQVMEDLVAVTGVMGGSILLAVLVDRVVSARGGGGAGPDGTAPTAPAGPPPSVTAGR